jgi:NAD(P)-dependent dehydrogenase (short-subunit alcohol dehydrogenase family)
LKPKPPRTVTGKTCLITGAASGIGRATAYETARRGGRLALTDVAVEGLEETVAEVRRRGGEVVFAEPADISDHEAVVAMAERFAAAHGSADVVMNVAGISAWGTVENLEHRQWRAMVDVNLMGPIHVIETFVPPMIEARRGGHLVNVSSAAGLFGFPWHAAYSASKFGLRGVSEVLRFDLRRHGIGVSLCCPGGVDTGLVQTVEIAGVDREAPNVRKMIARFRAHAQTPDHVARRIIEGIERNRYWVYTSADIRFGHFVQRKFELPYALAMRAASARATNAVVCASTSSRFVSLKISCRASSQIRISASGAITAIVSRTPAIGTIASSDPCIHRTGPCSCGPSAAA